MFKNRKEAGEKLAAELMKYLRRRNTIVLALPRGGIPIGYEISQKLHIPLDVIITRKIGAPGNPELAIGALAENGEVVLSDTTLTAYGVNRNYIKQKVDQEKAEIQRRIELYRAGRPLPKLEGKTVILVDDGIATGATLHIAIQAIEKEKPKKIVVAMPVAPPAAKQAFGKLVGEFVCLEFPLDFSAVGQFYEDFTAPDVEDLQALLQNRT